MLLIPCPHCGARAEIEFNYGVEADIVRPPDAAREDDGLDDRQWADYLFMRGNTLGPFRELWVHTQGCRRWFVLERDTRSHQFTDDRVDEEPA